MTALATCPHCHAIVGDGPFCLVCTKSPLEEVEITEDSSSDREPVDRMRLTRMTLWVIGIVIAVGVVKVVVDREAPVPEAPALPTPPSTAARTEGTAPTVEAPTSAAPTAASAAPAAASPLPTIAEGSETTGLAPWDTPPIDLSTGAPIAVDYEPGRTRVAELLAAVPAPWTLEDARRLDPGGLPVDVATAESSQPFAARHVVHPVMAGIGDVWLAAAPPDDPAGTAYVAALAARGTEGFIGETVTASGLRLRHAEVDTTTVWAGDVAPGSVAIVFSAPTATPEAVIGFLEDWRAASLPDAFD